MLGAVILNYGTAHDSAALAVDLAAAKQIRHVVVVDNKSPDDSVEVLGRALSLHPSVQLVEATANLGYSGGNLLGISRLRELGCSRVLVVNPDVRLVGDCLEHLVEELDQGHSLVSPVLMGTDGDVDSYGGAWDPMFGRGLLTTESSRDAVPRRCVRTFAGACFMADVQALDAVGGMPTRYFLYGEETEMVMRMRQVGRTWTVADRARAVHDRGSSLGSDVVASNRSAVSVYYSAESAMLLTRRWWPWFLILAAIARAIFAIMLMLRGRRDLGFAALHGLRSGLVLGLRRSDREVGDWQKRGRRARH